MRLWRSFRLFVGSHKKGLLVTLGVVVGLYLLLNASFYALSTNEDVCNSCHFIEPFYRSWTHSSHEGVDCISCHELGFGYFTSALFKTATGLYNPRPIAEVRDESCLQSGCHELEVVHRTTGFRQDIAFDHRTHLQQLRRGERLRCTSCHTADREGGTHFTTREETCYICHFKGAEEGKSVTECATCHTAPAKEVEHAGFRFDHKAYVDLGVSCEECHVRITRGTAGVDPNRCHDCHTERMGSFNDFTLIHDTHVTEHGISCFSCHSEIEHGAVEFIKVLDVKCESCHTELHSLQKQMYMGVGSRGLGDTPSRMFAAKVSCEGCHTSSTGEAGAAPGSRRRADEYEAKRKACVRCHGPGYDKMLDDWMRETKTALDFIAPLEKRAREVLASLDSSSPETQGAAEFLRDALHNIDLARRGEGAHNVEYAVHLISTSLDQITLAFRQLGKSVPSRRLPAVLIKPDGYCTSLCHNRLDTHGIEFFAEMEIDFDHEAHGHVSCTRCHSAQKHKQKVISKGECMSCHHSEEGQGYGVGCVDCHSAETGLYEGSVRVAGVDLEPDVMAESDVSCSDCHQAEAGGETLQTILRRCNDCHEEYEVEPLPVDDEFLEKQVALRRSSDRLIVALERQRVAVQNLDRRGQATSEMTRLLNEASDDLDVVLRGRFHHNFAAAEVILDRVAELLRQLEKLTAAGTR